MSGKQLFFLGSIALFFILLLTWGRVTGSIDGTWNGSSVPCLPSGHTNVAQHIHAQLNISVDGLAEIIPGDVGITARCMAEVHTHDSTGVIHVETIEADTRHPLKHFFEIWGRPLVREGYEFSMSVDGTANSALGELFLKEGQVIEIHYESPEYAALKQKVPEEEDPFVQEKKSKGSGGLQLE